MSSRRRRHRKSDEEPSEEMALQITSMADIFTIILVFLLKSFSTGLTTLSPAQGTQLPSVSASTKEQMQEALKLEVVANAVLVDQKIIARLHDFVPAEEADLMAAIENTLTAEHEKAIGRKPSSADGPRLENSLLVLADERTPYSTLKAIMISAANAGYLELQLVTLGVD